jgi:hypothetical protein
MDRPNPTQPVGTFATLLLRNHTHAAPIQVKTMAEVQPMAPKKGE